MTEETPAAATVAERIDAMEEAYEFMLAYAARGAMTEEASDEPGIRRFLAQLIAAIDGLAPAVAAEARRLAPGLAAASVGFAKVVEEDAVKAGLAVRLILALPSIGSQAIDNLNASIHLRALLADLFLIDDVLKS